MARDLVRNDGHVDDFTAWLRQRIQARLALARGTIELGNAAEWQELSSGVLLTGDGTEADHWHGMWAMGDSTLTRLMEANDPRDTIARCEAELAILDLYEEQSAKAGENAMQEDRAWTLASAVRLLGSAYKHQPGYREE
jgi:hypothetical protein